MEKTNRIFYFDALRAMAIIGIIFCHASISFVANDMGTLNFYISSFYDCFRDFSVPIFVMLSGALLIGKKDSFIAFFKKRLSRILIPFLFWTIISIVYSWAFLKHSIDMDNAIQIFFGHGGTMGVTFWFVWMIIIVYILIFIINKAIEHGNLKIESFDKKFIAVLAILSVIYIILFQQHFFDSAYYKSLLSYYFSFITFAIIGYCLVNTHFLESKIKAEKLVAITLILSVFSYIYYICCYVVPTSIIKNHFTYLGYFNIQILVISVCIFLLFKYLSKMDSFIKIEKAKFGKAIVSLSKLSYGIYLSHYLVLFILKRFIDMFVDISSLNSAIWIPILVVITLIISVLILKILNEIPYINKMTGLA